jgi:protein SCO1/2
LASSMQSRKISWAVWAGAALILATVVAAFLLVQIKLQLARGQPLPVYGSIADFTLTNQNGSAVSLADLRGHVWVADIIFTRCPGPCLKMTRQMKDLQDALPATSETRLVSLTTDPDFDTPPVLKTYGERFNAQPKRWTFLTGAKPQIANLATSSLKLAAVEKSPEAREAPNDLFIHTTIFVIVDRQARLRGVYETTGEGIEPAEVKAKILADIKRLEREG